MFLLSVSNLSDTDNAVARNDLRIEYRTAFNFSATVDIPSVSQDIDIFGGGSHSAIETGVKIEAHQTLVGKMFFRLNKAMLQDCAVDSYIIVVTDTHGKRTSVATSLVQEVFDETEIEKG